MSTWIKELLVLCRQEKKWLLVPLAVLLALVIVAAFLLAGNSGISWALYPAK